MLSATSCSPTLSMMMMDSSLIETRLDVGTGVIFSFMWMGTLAMRPAGRLQRPLQAPTRVHQRARVACEAR